METIQNTKNEIEQMIKDIHESRERTVASLDLADSLVAQMANIASCEAGKGNYNV